ncbi:MAG TPA: carbon-nitrogen hydrolase family protein [Verrucomicrobiae bacterium]
MKLAAIQFRPEKADVAGSVRRLESLIRQAGVGQPDLIVCPEMAYTGYLFANAPAAAERAEPAAGGYCAHFCDLAKALCSYLVVGYIEQAPDGKLYNSARVITGQGELVVNYRKRLLYKSDDTWAQPGRGRYALGGGKTGAYPILETPFGRLGVGICMDLNDDDFCAFLRRQQPDVLAFPTNWLDQGVDIRGYWHQRLYGVRTTLVAANTYGEETCAGHPRTKFLGRSAIMKLEAPSRLFEPFVRAETLAWAEASGDQILLDGI